MVRSFSVAALSKWAIIFNFCPKIHFSQLIYRYIFFQARTLILEGLKDRIGWIDYSMNPDLDNILENYNKPEQIFLTGWIGGLLVAILLP
ncbi:MAG: hypothetical protein ACTSWL_01835 [Promethearchaeota archaeon]